MVLGLVLLALLVVASGAWTIWPDIDAYRADQSLVDFPISMCLVFLFFVVPALRQVVVQYVFLIGIGVVITGFLVSMTFRGPHE